MPGTPQMISFELIIDLGTQRPYKQRKSRVRKRTLLGSQSLSMGVFSDDFAAVDFCEVLCNHSRPKKRKFRGADPIGQWRRRNLLQKIIRTSNRLLGSYYSGLVPVVGLEPTAGGRTRTDTDFTPQDFESSASASFTTPAQITI